MNSVLAIIHGLMRKVIFLTGILLSFLLFSCKTHKNVSEQPFQLIKDKLTDDKLTVENYLIEAIRQQKIWGNNHKAWQNLKAAYNTDPDNAAVLFKMGELSFYQNQMQDAEFYLNKALENDPENKWSYILLADVYKKTGELKKAVQIMALLVDKHPENPFYSLELSRLYRLTGQYSKALKLLDEMVNRFSFGPEIAMEMKEAYLSTGEIKKARNVLEKLVFAFPGESTYMKELFRLYEKTQDDEEAEKFYQQYTRLNPADEYIDLIITEYYIRTENPGKARYYSRKVFSNAYIDFDQKMKLLVSSFINRDTSQTSLLLEWTDKLLQENKEKGKLYAIRGDLFYSTNKTDSALANYLMALKYEKNLKFMWERTISLSFEKDKFEQVVELCKEALDYFPGSATLYLYKGLAENRLKLYEKAIQSFQNGLDYSGTNKEFRFQFLVNLAESYHALNDFEKMVENYEEALKIKNDDPLVLNNYAYYLSLENKNLEKARELAEKALDMDAENPAILDTYGWILYLQGNYQEALNYVEKAYQRKKWDADIMEHMGDIYFKLGHTDTAVMYWKKALKKVKESQRLENKIKHKSIDD